MCGIVASCSKESINRVLLNDLDKLRYRGYDSAGYALLVEGKKLEIAHTIEKTNLDVLKKQIQSAPYAYTGIAHTRWSTHGKAGIENAHPHYVNDTLALVHNGTIDNYLSIKKSLSTENPSIIWRSETDSEVIAQWLYWQYQSTQDIVMCLKKLKNIVQGTYALVIIHKDYPDKLFCICHGTPLVIGKNEHGFHIASDIEAFSTHCDQYHDIQPQTVYSVSQSNIEPDTNVTILWQNTPKESPTSKNTTDFIHKTLEEIYSQSNILNQLMVNVARDADIFYQIRALLTACEHITILGCGSSYYAGRTAKYWLESIGKKPTSIELASEFMDRRPCLPNKTLVIVISQSGETQDTISALRYIEANEIDKITLPILHKAKTTSVFSCSESIVQTTATICIGNRPTSTLAKTSTVFLPTYAGQEVGVATTKVFSSQLLRLAQLTYLINPTNHQAQSLYAGCTTLPDVITETLKLGPLLENFSQILCNEKHLLFLGKGPLYPIAEETALKVQELAYIHALAFASGEVRHGPLALVDENQWVFVFLNDDENFFRVVSNIHVIAANHGKIVLVGNKNCIDQIDEKLYEKTIELPEASPDITPFIAIVAMQIFSYHLAYHKGCSIDNPRGLAKCVSV
ncbi:MAG: glutamine--fructose-6-phosphate transaminase (isomerizing) [Pseudomonadota bacterium]|nr:glutamine--fructose-6-phosphate transaminase (isomerizing) [Pseudomonadota bacterium]